MFAKINRYRNLYPGQFWLMFFGMLIMTIGASMIWPFLMIIVSSRLNLPLTTAASLMTINAAMGLLSSFIAGPIIDRLGRKWVMVFSLLTNGSLYALMIWADSLPAFAVLLGLQGAVNPLFRVGGDAMMADLIPQEQRVEAYSLLRMSNNLGVALGPAIGGFIASRSYTIAFICAAVGMTTYGLLLLFRAKETLPAKAAGGAAAGEAKERFGGYGTVLRDGPFISFVFAFIFTSICASMIWVLLSVYTKTNFNLSESQYGLIPTTNAIMVVALQILVTRITRRFCHLPVMAIGSAFYALATFAIAFGTGFWWFWLCMVVMTVGELVLIPTSTTFVANLAPVHMRGRYMSIYGLTWGVATGIGPVLGGWLNDTFRPQAIWYGGGLVGLCSVLAFLGLIWWDGRKRRLAQQPA